MLSDRSTRRVRHPAKDQPNHLCFRPAPVSRTPGLPNKQCQNPRPCSHGKHIAQIVKITQFIIRNVAGQSNRVFQMQLANECLNARPVRSPAAKNIMHAWNGPPDCRQGSQNLIVALVSVRARQTGYGKNDRLIGPQSKAFQQMIRLGRPLKLRGGIRVGQYPHLLRRQRKVF